MLSLKFPLTVSRWACRQHPQCFFRQRQMSYWEAHQKQTTIHVLAGFTTEVNHLDKFKENGLQSMQPSKLTGLEPYGAGLNNTSKISPTLGKIVVTDYQSSKVQCIRTFKQWGGAESCPSSSIKTWGNASQLSFVWDTSTISPHFGL